MPAALPIDDLLPAILESLRLTPSLVIEAAPGAGKTTRVPPAVLALVSGQVIVLEPRRIAARLAARRVAQQLGEEVGQTVGYQVRFEDVTGPLTRLRFVTEGVLTRRLLTDPTLRGVDAVILDEFHERHLDSDLALALLKRLQQSRPNLLLIVMSATLDASPIAAYLDDCPILTSHGRSFPLTIRHTPYTPDPPHILVRKAAESLGNPSGELGKAHHTLVFLPGAAEIRRTQRECEPLAQRLGLLILPLHGDLTPAEQDRAIAPSTQPKLILATNVAESSVTIEGVNTVLDTGTARIASYSPWTGLPTLEVRRISQASARQRAGRAGRTGPGLAIRLYPEEDFQRRPAQDTPEILRADLSQLALALRVLGSPTLSWLDEPPPAAIDQAESLLDRLGATGRMATELARYPLPPRLARILVASLERGCGESAIHAVALLSTGNPTGRNDLLAALDLPLEGRALQVATQLRRIAKPPRQTEHDDDALLLAVLAGFPDRVAKRRAGAGNGNEVTLSNGTPAEILGTPPTYSLLLALDAEDRTEKPLPLIRMTARIEPEWLLDLFPDRIRETNELLWHRTAERVDAVSTLLYDDLILEQSSNARPNPEAAATLLAEKALEVLPRFVDAAALENLQVRFEVAGLPPPDLPATLRQFATGLRSFAELEQAAKHFLTLLEQSTDTRRLNEQAPAALRLAAGRQLKVHYDRGKPPWIESRLQDFFGMTTTPTIGGRPVVVHLLAPNHRAVQTTTDLAGFWQRLYPTVRKELMRRYPRHQWPEKPI